MMKQEKGQKETADQAYGIALKSLKLELAILSNKVDDHARRQRKERTNWGFAGDLNNVKARLAELTEFLGSEKEGA